MDAWTPDAVEHLLTAFRVQLSAGGVGFGVFMLLAIGLWKGTLSLHIGKKMKESRDD